MWASSAEREGRGAVNTAGEQTTHNTAELTEQDSGNWRAEPSLRCKQQQRGGLNKRVWDVVRGAAGMTETDWRRETSESGDGAVVQR